MKKILSVLLLAILGISSLTFIANVANADVKVEGTWVHIKGYITQWGSTEVFGWIRAIAGMVDRNGTYYEWAKANAVWSEDTFRLNSTDPPTENYTFTCYGASLTNTTDISLNDTTFAILGYWDIINITTIVTVLTDENGHVKISWEYSIEKIIENAAGELWVSPPVVELSITGIDTLSGTIHSLDISYHEIEICDASCDGKVNIIDLVRAAKRYRCVPGIWNYDHTIDVNFDNVIDIGDLTTIAAHMER